MKKLIFIDNDSERNVKEFGELDYALDFLELHGLLEKFGEVTPVFDFYSTVSEDYAYELLFDQDNIICTWSVYSNGGSRSLAQLMNYLRTAGISEVKDRIYIDTSGQIVKALNNNFKDYNQYYNIFHAIETNYILTNVTNELKRVRVQFKGADKDIFITEEFDKSLIETE